MKITIFFVKDMVIVSQGNTRKVIKDNPMNYNLIPFKTGENFYLYSGNTGRILQISERIFSLFQREAEFDFFILKELENKFPYVFTSSPVKRIVFGYSEEDIRDQINRNLQQMTLGITQRCNMRCNYCVYSGSFPKYRTHSEKRMSEEIAFKSADYFLDHIKQDGKPKFFTFYGGEPLLEFDLIKKVILHIKNKSKGNIFFSITTNGTLLEENKIKFLAENKIFLMISLDGPKEIHDRNRLMINGSPSFDLVMKNIGKIKLYDLNYWKYYVTFSVTFTDGCDYKKLDVFFSKLKKPLKASGVLSYGSEIVSPVKGTSTNMGYLVKKFINGCMSGAFNNFETSKEYLFALSVVGTVIKLIHKRKVANTCLLGKTYFLTKHCIPGATKIFVSTDGKFFPCEKLDSFSNLVIGDIYKGVDLTKVQKYIEIFLGIKNKFCKKCPFLDICNLCFQAASNGREWDENKFLLFCRYAKDDFKNGLKIYCSILEKKEGVLDFLLDLGNN